MYLVVLWLIVGGGRLIPDADDESLALRRLAELMDLAGRGPVVAALSLIAVLLGSLLTVPQWRWWPDPKAPPRFRSWDDMPSWCAPLYGWAGRRTEWMRRSPPAWKDLQRSRHLSDALLHELDVETRQEMNRGSITGSLGERQRSGAPELHPDPSSWARSQVAIMALVREVLGEIDLLAARLQVERESLYNEYDRLKSEAELRFSILTPVILLTATFTATWKWQAVAGLGIAAALFLQGIQAQRGARRLVVTAVVNGVVESPTAQGLDRFRDDYLSFGHPEMETSGTADDGLGAGDPEPSVEDGAPAPPADRAPAEPAP